MIFEKLMDCLYDEFAIKLFFPLFCICTRRTHIYVKYDNIIFECYYDTETKLFQIEQTNSWNDAKMVDFQKIKDATRKMKDAILDLISNYSAPPMGMSNRLTVVLQQELH